MIQAMPDPTDERTRRVPDVEVRVTSADYEVDELETLSLTAFMSSVSRAGDWEPPELIEVLAIMGEARIDLTQALMPPSGEVEIHATSIMGNVKVVVRLGTEVEIEGTPLLGSFEQKAPKWRKARKKVRELLVGESDEHEPGDEEPPYVRVTGLALLGSVEVIHE
jgi:predicted membrane protein